MHALPPTVYRTILTVDVEGFGDRRRTAPDRLAVREGLYRSLRAAFTSSGMSWDDCDHEDRGDGVLVLIPPAVPESLPVERLPQELVTALRQHNQTCAPEARIRLRAAVHAGEVHYDGHGVAGTAVNLAFRLLEAAELKSALAGSPGVLALIASERFYDEVIRQHSQSDPASYRQVHVAVKETRTIGWISLPDRPQLTLLHLSDLQFGGTQLFGGNGRVSADQADDVLFHRLHDDLDELADEQGLRPDLLVVTGDLAESGLRSEFQRASEFLAALAQAVGLSRRRVAIVPGNHDINQKACLAYFAGQEAHECDPVPPYRPKWEHFAAAFADFYDGVEGVGFTPDEPWTLFEIPDLRVVVAGLNSTMAESHRDGDHYGWVGEEQLRWFADRLADYRRRGWLRLAAVHHNVVGGAGLDAENLRDADDLDRLLGAPALVNLLLHGHTHDGGLHRLPSGLVTLPTGSTAVPAEARPHEVPNQYQLITVRPGEFTRYARHYVDGPRRWVDDTRVSRTALDWGDRLTYVRATFSGEDARDDLFDRIQETTRVRYPDALITPQPDDRCLRVSKPLPGGGIVQWLIGVVDGVDGAITAEGLQEFADSVHARFASADPQVWSVLVCRQQPGDHLVTAARRQRIQLCGFADYQDLIDLASFVSRQLERLVADRRHYPAGLYVPQRYRLLDPDPGAPEAELLDQVITWLDTDDARFVMLLGDSGCGKTFLLRQLARHLSGGLPVVLPVLVELRGLERASDIDELVAQYLARKGVEVVEMGKLRHSGRLVLLFDGFDELALRVSYEHAADYLRTLLGAVTDHTKIVLTSRTQHFQSAAQVRTALGTRVATMADSRVAIVEDFTMEQIQQFLVNHYVGDTKAAEARFDLLADIQDLLGLARNPRMLSFITALDEIRLREVQQRRDGISAAELYRGLIDSWLTKEEERIPHHE